MLKISELGRIFCTLLVITAALPACAASGDLPLHRITLPPGFKLELYARVPEARSLSVAPELGVVFVGTRGDAVYAIVDENRDQRADRVLKVLDNLEPGNSIAWTDGVLYASERTRVLRFDARSLDALKRAKPEIVFSGFADNHHHGKRYTTIGPDGRIYVGVGAPCNICSVDGFDGTITVIDPKSGRAGVFAHGVRNSVGMDFHPKTGELYFTDNGADRMGDNSPPDEFNHAPGAGLHFGYPYYGGGNDRTPDFQNETPPPNVTMPVVKFGAHVAALGFRFYRGQMLPPAYRSDAFVAQHGSWNRSIPDGYRVARVKFDARGRAIGWEAFAEGWLSKSGDVWGRPADVAELPDGSLLVSDDYAGAVYRITYNRP